MNWNAPEIQALVRAALKEDDARADITTNTLIDPSWRGEAAIIAKENGIIAGLPLAKRFFTALDPSIQFKFKVTDGAIVKPHQRLATIKGRARAILSAERPALNALQHLSGIATFSHDQVKKLKGTKTKLFDTRKTLPGWRLLQKYAVRCGGASNHRMSLADAVMIKENHLKIARLAGSDWLLQAKRLMKNRPAFPVQIEIQTLDDLRDVLRLKPRRVLLDNLMPKALKKMMTILREAIPGIEIEVTGGVRSENLKSLAALGPDRISMGRLTHSVPAFDCSLDILHVYSR